MDPMYSKYQKYKKKYLQLRSKQIGGNILNDNEVYGLNIFFNKKYSKEEWENLKTLYLTELPQEQFPAFFDKLINLKNIDLLHQEGKQDCENTNLQSDEIKKRIYNYINEKNKNFFMKKSNISINSQPIIICLNSSKYKLIDRLGQAGEEGVIYQIKNLDDNSSTNPGFAIKIYNLLLRQNGDWLSLAKDRKSKDLLVLPLIVNKEYGYSIFPVLNATLRLKGFTSNESQMIMDNFDKILNPLLIQDGLKLGDNLHKDNYMYDFNGNLKRIDFGSLDTFNIR